MARCNDCGKKGIFLRVDKDGRCKSCQESYIKKLKQIEYEKRMAADRAENEEKRKKNVAISKLSELLKLYEESDRHIYEETYDKCIPYIDCIREKIDKCDELYKELKNVEEDKYFREVVFDFANGTILNGECPDMKSSLSYKMALTRNFEKEETIDFLMIEMSSLIIKMEMDWRKAEDKVLKEMEKKEKKEKKANKEMIDIAKERNVDISSLEYPLMPDCVIVDIETSGLIYNRNSIIEISALKVVDGKVKEKFDTLIHRDKKLDKRITELTGITDEMLHNCDKNLSDAINEFDSFIGNLPLVGHNVSSFDIRFINEAYEKVLSHPIENQCIDTLKMAKEMFFEVPDHKLQTIAKVSKVNVTSSHRAMADCETTLQVFGFMINYPLCHILRWSEKGKPLYIDDSKYPKYVSKYFTDGSCCIFHDTLVKNGYLVECDTKTKLNSFQTTELKAVLKENKQKVSGNKVELVDRIIENGLENSFCCVYVPSETGKEHLEKYNNMLNDILSINRELFGWE